MIYLYSQNAGDKQVNLVGDEHKYIFKVKRYKLHDSINLRNLADNILYKYKITYIDKKSSILTLESSEYKEVLANKTLHLGWCVIDPKSIEKVLPSLNEIGVDKITFIYCERSQKNFKPDLERYKKILINSSQQSGRSQLMSLDICQSLDLFLKENESVYLLNFSKNTLTKGLNVDTLVIGCEGGLTTKEVSMFNTNRVVGLDTNLVLKSESAALSVSSLILF